MNDLDPILRDAMARVRRPIDARPSVSDVRRRARRRSRRRMTATVGAVACTGVATAALIIRHDSTSPSRVGTALTDSAEDPGATTTYPALLGTTTSIYGLPSLTITPSTVWDALWNARYDPAGAGLVVAPADQAAAEVMPTADQFGCTSPECHAMFTYVVWHEIALQLGFGDVRNMQATNPQIDFSQPPRAGEVIHSCCAVTTQSTVYVTSPDLTSTTTTSLVVPTTSGVFEDSSISTTTTGLAQIDSIVTP